MEQFINSLADYSNSILLILNFVLVLITGIYAFLTWRMVVEMRKARESQSDSTVIASPIPLAPIYAQVQVKNEGPSSALDIELRIALDPPLDTTERIWNYSALTANQVELFYLPLVKEPNGLPSLQQLAVKHERMIISLKWKTILGQAKSSNISYSLQDLVEGWYHGGQSIKPDDLPTQMEKATKVLDEIHDDLEAIGKILNQPIYAELIRNIKKSKPKTKRTSRNK